MAQTQIRSKKAQVALIQETGQDAIEAGLAADLILATDVSYTIDSAMWSGNYARGDGLNMDDVPGTASATVSFSVPLRGSGDVGDVATELTEAFKACGFNVVAAGGASGTETFIPELEFDDLGGSPGPSYSVHSLIDGMKFSAVGCFGNVVFVGEVGVPMMCNFTFQGAFSAVTDSPLLNGSATYLTTVPPAFMGATFAVNFGGAETPIGVENFTLDLGNQISLVRDVNSTYGIAGARIVSRKTTGSFNPELELVASNDYFGKWRAGTTGTIATGKIGAQHNRYSLSVARSVTGVPALADRNGIQALTIPFTVSSAATDDEVTNPDFTLLFD